VWAALAAPVDPSGLRAERNVLRHLPLGRVVVRHDGREPDGLAVARHAAGVVGACIEESDTRVEDDDACAQRLPGADRLRLLTTAGPELVAAAVAAGVTVDREPPSRWGAIEARRWCREQAISETAHRHGRLLAATVTDELGAAVVQRSAASQVPHSRPR
jgi:RHH-type proline utilization regulon transcriptional repressor/proline dehydrogenase/delta 1-pyrroline-5-carboxylate dehydrogenase